MTKRRHILTISLSILFNLSSPSHGNLGFWEGPNGDWSCLGGYGRIAGGGSVKKVKKPKQRDGSSVSKRLKEAHQERMREATRKRVENSIAYNKRKKEAVIAEPQKAASYWGVVDPTSEKGRLDPYVQAVHDAGDYLVTGLRDLRGNSKYGTSETASEVSTILRNYGDIIEQNLRVLELIKEVGQEDGQVLRRELRTFLKDIYRDEMKLIAPLGVKDRGRVQRQLERLSQLRDRAKNIFQEEEGAKAQAKAEEKAETVESEELEVVDDGKYDGLIARLKEVGEPMGITVIDAKDLPKEKGAKEPAKKPAAKSAEPETMTAKLVEVDGMLRWILPGEEMPANLEPVTDGKYDGLIANMQAAGMDVRKPASAKNETMPKIKPGKKPTSGKVKNPQQPIKAQAKPQAKAVKEKMDFKQAREVAGNFADQMDFGNGQWSGEKYDPKAFDMDAAKRHAEAQVAGYEQKGVHFETLTDPKEVLRAFEESGIKENIPETYEAIKGMLTTLQKSGNLQGVAFRGLKDVDKGVHYYSQPYFLSVYVKGGETGRRFDLDFEMGD